MRSGAMVPLSCGSIMVLVSVLLQLVSATDFGVAAKWSRTCDVYTTKVNEVPQKEVPQKDGWQLSASVKLPYMVCVYVNSSGVVPDDSVVRDDSVIPGGIDIGFWSIRPIPFWFMCYQCNDFRYSHGWIYPIAISIESSGLLWHLDKMDKSDPNLQPYKSRNEIIVGRFDPKRSLVLFNMQLWKGTDGNHRETVIDLRNSYTNTSHMFHGTRHEVGEVKMGVDPFAKRITELTVGGSLHHIFDRRNIPRLAGKKSTGSNQLTCRDDTTSFTINDEDDWYYPEEFWTKSLSNQIG
eukprot:Lankesteria_metandrocarpae@DN416_c0_g1_i1.p1